MADHLVRLFSTPLIKWPKKLVRLALHQFKDLFVEWVIRLGLMRLISTESLGEQQLLGRSIDILAAHFSTSSELRSSILALFRSIAPETEKLVVEKADCICQHVFDLLGSGPVSLGEDIDWHTDFKTGHRFNPKAYYKRIRPAPYPGGYDIKVPWELSRCQHFVWLGQAYWLTEDEKYACEFVTQVEDWIASNPWPWGVNWACTMDVAIRVVNWLWGYHFFNRSSSLSDEFRLAFYKSLLVHGRHIWHNLENQGDFANNHYLSDLVGLVYLGILCPEFKESRRWREFGLRELEKEMFKQVYPDGVNFEASTAYHRLATELFLSATILAQRTGYSFSSKYLERLEKMVEFVMYLTKPDGTVPLIGDNDNGRLHRLKVWSPPEREWVDYRYLLAIGAVLFQRKDLAQAAGEQWEDAFWLFGEEAITFRRNIEAKWSSSLQLQSQAVTDAGLYIMRCDNVALVVDAGPVGQNGNGGHAHNDVFSFDLFAGGQSWIVDPGTYVYTADYCARNQFRATACHNTVIVDGQEQNSFREEVLFSLTKGPSLRVNCWHTNPDYDLFEGEHDAYTRLADPVMHRRQIFFHKTPPVFWIIRDLLSGQGRHTLELFFHIGDATPHVLSSRIVGLQGRVATTEGLIIISLESEQVTLHIRDSWRAPGYGEKIQSQTVCYQKEVAVPAEFVTMLYPVSVSGSFVGATEHTSLVAQSAWKEAEKILMEQLEK